MKLTKKSHYAVIAILDIVKNSKRSSVRLQDISTRQNISLDYLEQIFKKLREGGIVKSFRGPGGGYMLASKPSKLKVKQILESIGEGTRLAVKDFKTKEEEILHTFLDKIENTIYKKLNISVGKLSQ